MSAYIVSKKHIDFLVSAAHLWSRGNVGTYLPRGIAQRGLAASVGVTDRDLHFADFSSTELGKLLWSENFASIEALYGPKHGMAAGVGDKSSTRWEVDEYKFQIDVNASSQSNAVKVIKAIQCLEYQSCEHDGWEASAANHFCKALLSEAISHLPGYEAVGWGL